MAIKVGFAYYNTDTDRYQDIKIKRLKKDFGCAGIAVYDYILCEIYRVKGCFIEWDENTAFDVSEYFALKESTVNEIVNYCCSVGLFDDHLFKTDQILTSYAIQTQWLKRIVSIDFDIIPKRIILIPFDEIPNYKKNPKSRLHQKNFKLWKRITKEVFARDDYTCKYCGVRGGVLEVDHVVPFSKGGSDELWNLAAACRKCNRQKRDKTVDEFKLWQDQQK